jgi:hypothetical protein
MNPKLRSRFACLARSLRRPGAQLAVRPGLLKLEDSTMLSIFTVVNLSDASPGSLRYELVQAHRDDTVVFARDLQGTITLTSGELQVGQDVTIQGPRPWSGCAPIWRPGPSDPGS